MTDLESMFRAVVNNPTDTTIRLAYADMLDEHGRPVDAALHRVIAQPDRDDLRLAYADAVDATPVVCRYCSGEGCSQHGHGADFARRCDGSGRVIDRERAEFVRVQVELASTPEPEYKTIGSVIPDDTAVYRWGTCPACVKTRPGRCRYHTLVLRANEMRSLDFTSERAVFGDTTDVYERRWDFHRGFVRRVVMHFADWVRHPDLRHEHPLETVELLDRPAMESRRSPDRWADDVRIVSGNWHSANLVANRAAEFGGDWSRALLDLEYPGLSFELPHATARVQLASGGMTAVLQARGEIRAGDMVYADDDGKVVSARYVGPGGTTRLPLGVAVSSDIPPGVRL